MKAVPIDAPLSLDLAAASGVGALAGVFASIVAADLGLHASPFLLVAGLVAACLAGIVAARIAARFSPALYAFGKFGEVGGLNWLFDLGVLNLLILATGHSTGGWFIAFKGLSFLGAATNSYVWNASWVFRDRARRGAPEISRFALATATGLAFNVALAYAVVRAGPLVLAGADALGPKAWANLAGVVGSLGGMLLNFALYRAWVFKVAANPEPVSG